MTGEAGRSLSRQLSIAGLGGVAEAGSHEAPQAPPPVLLQRPCLEFRRGHILAGTGCARGETTFRMSDWTRTYYILQEFHKKINN